MAIFVCPNCAHAQEAPDAYVGRSARCLKCQARGEVTPSVPKPPVIKAPTVVDPRPSTPPPSTPAAPAAVTRGDLRIVIGLLVALLGAQLLGLTSTQSSATRWEYRVESPEDALLQVVLDRSGLDGWELVFARRATTDLGSVKYEMILKRPKR